MTRELDALRRLNVEDKIPLKKAGPLIPGSPSLRSLQRYVSNGYYCPILDDKIYLEAFRGSGRHWWTSQQAICRFNNRINGDE